MKLRLLFTRGLLAATAPAAGAHSSVGLCLPVDTGVEHLTNLGAGGHSS
jgi:hypothetical protein